MKDVLSTDLVVEARRSLASQVYETILRGIVTGAFAPHERMIETDLTERLQVSRTPVREAFSRLASEGLLLRLKGGGYEVVACTEKEIAEIFDTRLVLELHLMEVAIARVTDEDAARLLDAACDIDYYTGRDDPTRLYMAHDHFHATLRRIAGNAKLAEILAGLDRQASLMHMHLLRTPESRRFLANACLELADALARRDLPAASASTRARLRRTTELLLDRIRPR